MANLTKRLVESAKPGPGRETVLWDSACPGFYCRVFRSGVRSYGVYYRTKTGRQRRLSIGRHGVFTVEQARAKARKLLNQAAEGNDPAVEREAERKEMSFADLAEAFLDDAKVRTKPKTVFHHRWRLDTHVLPVLGKWRLGEIGRGEILQLQRVLQDRPVLWNRVRATLHAMFAKAEAWGYLPEGTNPVRHVAKFRERSRERFLTPEEFRRLSDVLDKAERQGVLLVKKESPKGEDQHEEESPTEEEPHVISLEAVAAIRLLVFTGARVGEILNLTWAMVDTENRVLRLSDSKTGEKSIFLNPPALEAIASLAERADAKKPWVVPGRLQDKPMVNLGKSWRWIRSVAGLKDVHLHDLRHCVATVGAGLGYGLTTVGLLLGHREPRTTLKYSHIGAAAAREAAERIGQAIQGMMAGGAEVIDVAGGRQGEEKAETGR